MPPSSPRSRRRWSRSWRRSARCRPCWRGASRSPRGGSRGPIASRPSCSRSGAVADGGLGLALIRDGNGARSFETLLRYRGAAMAEFWRALKTLKALQAEQPALADMSAEGYPADRAGRSSATGPNGAPSDTGPPRGAPEHQRTEAASATGRTRARRPAPPGICRRRAIHIRPHAARARRSLAAERTRERPRGMHRRPQGSEWAAPLTVGGRLASLTVRGHRA